MASPVPADVASCLAARDLVRGLSRPLTSSRRTSLTCHSVAECVALAQRDRWSCRSPRPWLDVERLALALRERGELRRRDQLVLGAVDDVRETCRRRSGRAPWGGRGSPRTRAAARAAAAAGRPGRARPRSPSSPRSARWSDRTRCPNEWKLWTHSRLAISSPSASSSRSMSSAAALTLYVRTRTFSGSRSGVRCQQVTDALDDDRRLAGARTGEHHQWAVSPFDGGALVSCEFEAAFGDRTLRQRLNCHSAQAYVVCVPPCLSRRSEVEPLAANSLGRQPTRAHQNAASSPRSSPRCRTGRHDGTVRPTATALVQGVGQLLLGPASRAGPAPHCADRADARPWADSRAAGHRARDLRCAPDSRARRRTTRRG